MRNLLIIGILLVGASMAGWFKVQRDGESTTIEINRNEIRSDARQAIDRGREFLDGRGREIADQQPAEQQQSAGQDQQQHLSQEQVAPQQQWGTIYDPQQQPNDGGAYQQVQFYNDVSQQGQQTQNQPINQGQANPYPQQQNYRR